MEEKDLYTELQDKTRQLDIAIKQLRKSATDYAEADRNYYLIKTEQVIKLKDANNPVTYISLIIKGIRPVADARFKMIIAQELLNANKEAIYSLKLQMRLIEGQINREWGSASNG